MAARTLIIGFLILGGSASRADSPRLGPGGYSGHVGPLGNGEAAPIDAAVTPPVVAPLPRTVVRRPVAVVDLTTGTTSDNEDTAVRELANQLLDILASHTELAPPAISDGAALVDKPPVDDEIRLAEAYNKKKSAERNLAQRNFREAAIDAVEGQELLLRVAPRAALRLYADLALSLGQSRLGEKNEEQAREAFALAYRLDPRRTLDELHYLPEVVQAFESAKHTTPGTGTIAVRGSGRVWIDGEEVGSAPGEFKASYGRHVVWLTGLLRDAAGKEVLVTPARPGDATIMDGPLTRPQKVVRFRAALAQAQDAATRASAMAALAAFVNVRDAVLVWLANGKIHYQIWQDREPGFGVIRELDRDSPIEILRPLIPPPVVEAESVVVLQPPVEPEKRWYARRSVQIGVAATVVAAIIGGFLWSHYQEPWQPWDPNIRSGTASKQ